jgi:hypothetical protein
MSSPDKLPPRPAKSRVIVGAKANKNAKPPRKDEAKATQTHADYGEIDMSSPLLSKSSRSRGPKRSAFKWAGVTVFIKLFRLSVKFIPVAGALAAAVYGYTYFFGSIPLVDSIKREFGMEVAPATQTESRVNQMLGQTQDAIASSDARVHLGNAIAAGDTTTIDAIESGQSVAPASAAPPIARPAVAPPATRSPPTPDGPSVAEKLGDMLTSITAEVVPSKPPEPVDPGETISRQVTLDGEANSSSSPNAGPPPPPRQITIVQNSRMAVRSPFQNIDYRKGPGPSAAFSQWVQSLEIRNVRPEFKPKASINGMTFVAGEMVDFALGITFAGTAEDGEVVVFRDARGAHVTVRP